MAGITFKPKQVVKRLLAALPDRARTVITLRFGLGDSSANVTLEAIGKKYGITRERVRQIENYAIATIRKSDAFKKEQPALDELKNLFDDMGGIVAEHELLNHVAKDESTQNHVHLLLVLGEAFNLEKENEEFRHRWFTDSAHATKVEKALRNLYANLADNDLVPESQLVDSFLKEVKDMNVKFKDEEVVRRWLGLSKTLGKNPLGEWGRAHSPNVRVKGMRDYAYLAIKRHGSPMHFSEVAKAIVELFNKRAHVATCHNELIKDPRFVLVGRGLYALTEWGYTAGVVKDVIRGILKSTGPLTRDEIINRVRKERYVKDNTILVNLQDSRYFKKDKAGRYTVA